MFNVAGTAVDTTLESCGAMAVDSGGMASGNAGYWITNAQGLVNGLHGLGTAACQYHPIAS